MTKQETKRSPSYTYLTYRATSSMACLLYHAGRWRCRSVGHHNFQVELFLTLTCCSKQRYVVNNVFLTSLSSCPAGIHGTLTIPIRLSGLHLTVTEFQHHPNTAQTTTTIGWRYRPPVPIRPSRRTEPLQRPRESTPGHGKSIQTFRRV